MCTSGCLGKDGHSRNDAGGIVVGLITEFYTGGSPVRKIAKDGEITSEYQKIPLLWAFAVKYDGRHRARLFAGGHVTEDLEQDSISNLSATVHPAPQPRTRTSRERTYLSGVSPNLPCNELEERVAFSRKLSARSGK